MKVPPTEDGKVRKAVGDTIYMRPHGRRLDALVIAIVNAPSPDCKPGAGDVAALDLLGQGQLPHVPS